MQLSETKEKRLYYSKENKNIPVKIVRHLNVTGEAKAIDFPRNDFQILRISHCGSEEVEGGLVGH